MKAKKLVETESKRRSTKPAKAKLQAKRRSDELHAQEQPRPEKAQAPTPKTRAEELVGQDFERLLDEHFAQEQQKKVEQVTDDIFGSVLARHGWVRNEQGQVEYVGGEGR